MQRNVTCPSCHRGLFPGDAFCSWCGMPIAERTETSGAARRTHATETIPSGDRQNCASCHSPILPGDAFCATCGARYGVVEVEASSGYDSHVPSQLVEAIRGKYEILRELGRGGMGYVYLARDLELDRLDAIKVLKPSMLAEDGMVERFRAEARTIAKLRHPSVVTVYGVGNAGSLHYFVMDYIEGTSLSRVLKQEGRLSIQATEAILYQVGSALSYAHQSIIHRDVKPANVMLTRQGRAVVTDFGIAKVTESQAGLTRTGVLMGTPEYMSPEQCREASVTPHSDQYALGAVAFAMLTGAPPFTGQWLQVAAAHQTKPVPTVQDFRPDCPPELAHAVERMLAKYPTERWPDIKDALRHLGLRPLAPDDPALEEISALVNNTMEIDEIQRAGHPGVTPASSRTPTDLRIVAPPEDVELGDVVMLHASMVFEDGMERHGQGLTWETTDPSIATVDSGTGELQAVGVGSVQITARHGGVAGSLALGVVPPRVVELAIQPRSVEIECGEAVQLLAEARNKRGERLERPITWSSSDPRAVRVSDRGVVTAYKVGSASVLAHCEGTGAAAMIMVRGGVETSIPPTHPPTGHLVAEPTPSTGHPAPVATLPEMAALSRGGRAGQGPPTGRGAPTVVAAPEEPEKTAAMRPRAGTLQDAKPTPVWRRPAVAVPVLLVAAIGAAVPFMLPKGEPEVGGLRVSHAQTGESVAGGLELAYGESLRLVATVTDRDGNALPDRTVTWSSVDPSVARVDPTGLLQAAAGGVTRIVATVDTMTRAIPVTVTVRVTSIQILGSGGAPVSDLAVDVGASVTLTARVVGEDGNALDRPVSWRSGNPSVIEVDGGGTLTAAAAGSTTIEASAAGVSARLGVRVAGAVATPPDRPARPVEVDIVIVGTPFATLYLNDILIGQEQRSYRVTLPPGLNRIRLVHPAVPAYTGTINTQNLVTEPGQARPQVVIRMTR